MGKNIEKNIEKNISNDNTNPRQLAFIALRSVYKGKFADEALDRVLHQTNIADVDRRLVTELVYGCVRRMRSLDAIIDQLAKKKASQQSPDLRTILHLGLYQLRYLTHIPPAAAVNTTVELTKQNHLANLGGFVNGLLRQYIRLSNPNNSEFPAENNLIDPLKLPENPGDRLGILHSYPDWIISLWLAEIGLTETEELCQYMNKTPSIDLRVNPMLSSVETVETALQAEGISVSRLPYLPQALRLNSNLGKIQNLPGFKQGYWTIQDSSAQLPVLLLDPQPGEIIIDACAAPGGKTTQIAELMTDIGTIWACDKIANRLKKLKENTDRLQLKSIKIITGDSRNFNQFISIADRVLLDAPCSGLGTLHRRADARWKHTPENIKELAKLQGELLTETAKWVKPGGILVYSTCTLHPLENENVIITFLNNHSNWQIIPPDTNSPAANFTTQEGWVKVWPHRHIMDGFFMVKLQKKC